MCVDHLEKLTRIMMAAKGEMWKSVAEKFNELTGDTLTRQTLKTRIVKGTISAHDFGIVCGILGCAMYIIGKDMESKALTTADYENHFRDVSVAGLMKVLEYLGYTLVVRPHGSDRALVDNYRL